MKIIRFILFLLLCLNCQDKASSLNIFSKREQEIYEKQLVILDNILKQKEVFVAAKKERILQLKKQKSKAYSNAEKYLMNKLIYDEYRLYNADSALYYLEKNKELAQQAHNQEWMITSQLEQSFVLMSTGFLKEAIDIVRNIQVSKLSRSLKSKYYGQMRALYSRLRDYSDGNSQLWHKYDNLQRKYRDSVCITATPNESRYLNNMIWKHIGTPKAAAFKPILEKNIASSSPDTRYYVVMTYNLASIYKYEGNESKYLQYLILSAMADIRTINGDIGSLYELAQYLFSNGDIERAHTYVNYYSQNAQTYLNRVRFFSASKLQSSIQQAYQKRNREQQKRLTILLITVSLLSVILIGAFLFIRQQMKRLTKSGKELDEANGLLSNHMQNLSDAHLRLEKTNTQLEEANVKLKKINMELFEANNSKEEYIAYVFNICSSYISKLEEYRKSINRKLTVGQIEDAKKLTDSSAIESNEIKEFNQKFDKIILNLYPDFVENFNRLLLPEERIELKEGELNTELRIHALIRLGIRDSGKIADFLHCSPQTIYNSRFKTRNKTNIPKDEFIQAIHGIGKYDI
jgi:hypothetical protein